MKPGHRTGLVFVVSAPSGAGKTSLVKAALEQDPQLVVSVSHTTRPMRPGEQNGVNYHFVTDEEFQEMIDQDAFLEHAQVFGHRYGTSKAAVDHELSRGRDVVLEIDCQGARQVRSAYPACCSIFILPPSRATLTQRLQTRGQDSAEVIAQRTKKATEEMDHHSDFDYLIVNEDFEQATDELTTIVQASRLGRIPQQQALQGLLQDLLQTPGQ